jgi:hypothetical protein
MANDISLVEPDHGDAIDPFESFDGIDEAAFDIGWQVDLGHIACDDNF